MAVVAGLLLAARPLRAQTLTTLYNFCTPTNCANGYAPYAGLVQGSDGNFYGTTTVGGANLAVTGIGGTVFRINPNSPPGTGLTTLYSFCSTSSPPVVCTDGQEPFAGVIQGSDGNFYGTTYLGGANEGSGTIFKISPGGALTTIYSFCSVYACADGSGPAGGLVQGSDGNFYGTTEKGGAYGAGTVFKITPSGTPPTTYTLTTLYSFCSQSGCTDGGSPQVGLVQGSDGNFYGTTNSGGTNSGGTVFQITPSGTLTTLYSFCSQSGCTDGLHAYAALIQGNDGNLYGTTYNGGTHSQAGTVFKINPNSPPGTGLTTLYSFCAQSSATESCTDGEYPYGGLVQASDGNFYGTTAAGALTAGTVFEITPSGTPPTIYTLTTLYTFCTQSGCTDGGAPFGALVQGSDGKLYGTTSFYGAYGGGTVFALPPPAAPTITFSAPSLNFGNVPLGMASAAMSVTLTNSGSANLIMGALIVSGANSADFGITSDTCSGQTIGWTAPNNTCAVGVAFTPSLSGGEAASLNFPDNAPGTPQSVALSGTGTLPIASLSPGSLTFSSQTVGTTSAVQPVTVSNNGTASLTISSIAISSEFAQTNNCGNSVAAGGNCTINVTFSPALSATPGTLTGTLAITDNSNGIAGSMQMVSLSGTATSSGGGGAAQVTDMETITVTDSEAVNAFTLSPVINVGAPVAFFSTGTPLGFGGQTGSQQTIAVSNIGQVSMTLDSATISSGAPFTLSAIQCFSGATASGAASATLPSGDFCTLTITYTGSSPATDAGTLTFTDNAALSNLTDVASGSNYTQSIALTGSGAGTAPPAAPPATVPVSDNEPITVTDMVSVTTSLIITGPSTLPSGTVGLPYPATTFTASGGSGMGYTWSITSGGPALSAAGLSLSTAGVLSGTPTAAGTYPITVQVTDSASNTYSSNFSLAVAPAAPIVSLSPTSLTFGAQASGTASAAQTVTLSNTGSAALSITGTGINITGANATDFSQTNPCGASVAAGGNCVISVTFTPSLSAGSETATLNVNDTAGGSPQQVQLSGIALPPPSVSCTIPTVSLSGDSGTAQITCTATDFSGMIALECNLPASLSKYISCSFSPSSLNFASSSTATTTLTIEAVKDTNASVERNSRPWAVSSGGVALGAVLWLPTFAFVMRRKKGRSKRGVLFLLILLCGLPLITSCAGKSGPPTPPAGTYQASVTLTGPGLNETIMFTIQEP